MCPSTVGLDPDCAMNMQVILLEDVEHVGSVGTQVAVRRGFGRNYLLPRRLAVVASPRNQRELAHQQRLAEHRRAKVRAAADASAKQVAGIKLVIARKVGEQDKLFGSVTASDVAEALAAKGVKVDRRKISLSEPIRALGEVVLKVRLGADVQADVTLSIVAEEA